MVNKLTAKQKKEYDYIYEHKRTGEEFGTSDKKHLSAVAKSPSWKCVKQPKKAQ